MNAWDLDSPIQPSRWQWRLLCALHALTALAVLSASLPWWLQTLACLMLVLMLAVQWRQQHSAAAVCRLLIDDEQWAVILASGQRLRVRLREHAAWRWLIVLQLQQLDAGGTRSLLLFADALPADDFRRLHVRLRLAAGQPLRQQQDVR